MKVKEHPILFSTPMVQAILEGRKTQTRRVIKNPNKYERIELCGFCCPYGFKGDRLWVRETWKLDEYDNELTIYKADIPADVLAEAGDLVKWRPSIFMPRTRSRITLEITDVKVERVQDISEEDAHAEGIYEAGTIPRIHGICGGELYYSGFADKWDELNAKRGYSWDSNPWTWAISFQRVFLV